MAGKEGVREAEVHPILRRDPEAPLEGLPMGLSSCATYYAGADLRASESGCAA